MNRGNFNGVSISSEDIVEGEEMDDSACTSSSAGNLESFSFL
jgi:hypothetical protein